MKEGIIQRDKELNFDKANDLFKQSIKEDPKSSMAYFNLALSYFRQQEDNLEDLTRKGVNMALKLNPFNENAIALQSQLQENLLNKYNLLQKALNLNKLNSYILNLIGLHFKGEKKFKEAKKYLYLAIKYNNNFGIPYFNLALIKREEQQFENAIKVFKLGIGRDFSDSLFLIYIGKIYLSKDNQIEGEHYLELAVKSNKRCLDSKYELAKLYRKNNKLEQATKLCYQLISISPQQEYFNELHEALLKNKNYEECESQALKAVEINKIFDSYFNLAQISARRNKKQQLIDSFDQALLIEPENANAYGAYGEFLEEVGDKRSALNKYIKCSELGEDCESRINQLRKELNIFD